MSRDEFDSVWETALSLFPTGRPPKGNSGYWQVFSYWSQQELKRAFSKVSSETDWFPGISSLKKAGRAITAQEEDRDKYHGLARTYDQVDQHNAEMRRRQHQAHHDLAESDPDKHARIERVKRAFCDGQLCPTCFGAPYDGCPDCHGDGWDPESTTETRAAALQKAGAWMSLGGVR